MDLERLIASAAALGASDIHLACGLPPKLRRDGVLTDMVGEAPLTDPECESLARELARAGASPRRRAPAPGTRTPGR